MRPPLIYGPYVKANFLALIKAIDFGLPLPFLNLENFRSYLYLENLVDLILKVIEENKFLNNFYYVCDGNAVSTKHLSDLIANHLSKKPLNPPVAYQGYSLRTPRFRPSDKGRGGSVCCRRPVD